MIYGALVPNPEAVLHFKANDKLEHFAEYVIFSTIVFITISQYRKTDQYIITILVSSVVGIFTEIIQLSTTTRTASIFDYLADLSGALFAMLVIRIIFLVSKKPAI